MRSIPGCFDGPFTATDTTFTFVYTMSLANAAMPISLFCHTETRTNYTAMCCLHFWLHPFRLYTSD